MSKMKITLVPFFGMGNRLNALASAIALKAEKGYDIVAYWEKTDDCHAWFEELFCPIQQIEVRHLQNCYMKPATKANLWLPSLLRRFIYDRSFKATHIWNKSTLLHPEENWKHIYVEAHKELCPLPPMQGLGSIFRPVPQIEERIAAITGQYAPTTVGVHIRRTDHKVVIKDNPLESFIHAMARCTEENPGCKFFLATDDAQVKEQVSNTFPGRVVTMQSNLSRNSLQGMQDAVAELYALARCNAIIGSYGSTFSELAARLYDHPISYPCKA